MILYQDGGTGENEELRSAEKTGGKVYEEEEFFVLTLGAAMMMEWLSMRMAKRQ